MTTDPTALIDASGRVQTGMFDTSIACINGQDFDYHTPMGARHGAFARRFHYKQFQYFGVLSEQWLAGCALAHTGYLGLAFVYIYDTKTRRMASETIRLPLGKGLAMSRSPTQGHSGFSGRGADIRMDYARRPEGGLQKTLSVRTAKGLSINAELIEPPAYQALSLCTQTGYSGWTYTNKVAGLPVRGTLCSPLGNADLAGIDACGNHDFSAGYMRRETFWNWACLSGRTGNHTLGLNLSCGVNETSYSENCVWVDGERFACGLARFHFDRNDTRRPWRITAGDENSPAALVLTVTPTGLHQERLNLGLFATNFRQYFGPFHGSITVRDHTFPVNGLWGFVEDQYAKW